MAEPSRPAAARLSALAIIVLEDAALDARAMAIRPTVAHRLALAWLTYSGVAAPWQAENFWQNLCKFSNPGILQAQYCRDRDFGLLFTAWRASAGLPATSFWHRLERTLTDE